MTEGRPKRSGLPDTVRTIGALSTVGFSFVLAIVLGAGAGYFLMTRFGLGRWVFFLFFVFGVAAGILNVYRTAGRFLDSHKQVHDDPLVRRIGRDSAVICLVTAAAAAAVWGWPVAAGVLGGGLLIGISFYTIGSGVSAIVAAASGGASGGGASRTTLGGSLVKLTVRYALLGFLAYVMIARLRLHPIGLLVGASSVPAAAFVEAARLLVKRTL